MTENKFNQKDVERLNEVFEQMGKGPAHERFVELGAKRLGDRRSDLLDAFQHWDDEGCKAQSALIWAACAASHFEAIKLAYDLRPEQDAIGWRGRLPTGTYLLNRLLRVEQACNEITNFNGLVLVLSTLSEGAAKEEYIAAVHEIEPQLRRKIADELALNEDIARDEVEALVRHGNRYINALANAVATIQSESRLGKVSAGRAAEQPALVGFAKELSEIWKFLTGKPPTTSVFTGNNDNQNKLAHQFGITRHTDDPEFVLFAKVISKNCNLETTSRKRLQTALSQNNPECDE